jgi:hypothetical protein
MLKRSLQAKRIKTSRDGDFTWRRSWINTIPNYLKKMTPKTKILLDNWNFRSSVMNVTTEV